MKLHHWLLLGVFQIHFIQSAKTSSQVDDLEETPISMNQFKEANLGCNNGGDAPCEPVTRISSMTGDSQLAPSFPTLSPAEPGATSVSNLEDINNKTLSEVYPKSVPPSRESDMRSTQKSENFGPKILRGSVMLVSQRTTEGLQENENFTTEVETIPGDAASIRYATSPEDVISSGDANTPGDVTHATNNASLGNDHSVGYILRSSYNHSQGYIRRSSYNHSQGYIRRSSYNQSQGYIRRSSYNHSQGYIRRSSSPTPRDTSADQATTNPRDTSSDQATTTPRDTSADQATTTPRDTSADQATTTPRDTSADQATTTPRDTSADQATTTPRDTSADQATTTPRDTSSDQATTNPRDTSSTQETTTPWSTSSTGHTVTPGDSPFAGNSTSRGNATEGIKERDEDEESSCPVGDCSSFVSSKYVSKTITPWKYDEFEQLITYVDKFVCSPGTTRLAVETAEEQMTLVTCLFCNDMSWFAAQPKKHILTAGMVNLTDIPNKLPVEAVQEYGYWNYWDVAMDTNIPSNVVLLNPLSGEEMPSGVPLEPEIYAIVLMGTTVDSCISDTLDSCPYSKWGLISTRAAKEAFANVAITVCESGAEDTTTTLTSPTTSTGEQGASTEATTTPTPAESTTTALLTSSTYESSATSSRSTTTTTKVITPIAEDCCYVETGAPPWVCPGKIRRRACPVDGYVGYQTVTCHPGQRLFVVEDRCVQKWIVGVQDQIESGNCSAADISSEVKSLTNQYTSLTPSDLSTLIGVLSNLTALAAQQEVAGNLGGSLLQNLESSGFLLAEQISNTTRRFNSSEVQLSVFAISRNSSEDVNLFIPDDHHRTSFHLPEDFGSLLEDNSTQVRLVSFRVEQQSALRALPAALNRDVKYGSYKEMNSPLLSVSVGGVGQQINFTEMEDMAIIRFEHSSPEAGPVFRQLFRDRRPGEQATPVPQTATCVYWDTETSQWSPDGCYVINTTHHVTYCGCDHLTMFAILTDIHSYIGRDQVLDILGTVLSTISCVSLFVAFGILHYYKSIASQRVSITKQLCAALGIAHLLLLFLLDRDFLKLSESACSVAAIVLHYWLTASLFWMLAEGLHLLQTVTDVLSHASYMPVYWLLGYGVPAILVMTTILVAYGIGQWSSQDAYAPPYSEYCWLSTEHGYIWTFTGPLIVIVILNTFSMMVALRSAATLRTNKQKTLPEQIRLWVKGSFSLNCLLGTTWVFGFLYINTGHVFAYIFTIFNASQGLMILVLHCIVNESVRTAILNSLPDRISKHLKKQTKAPPTRRTRKVAVVSQQGPTPVRALSKDENSSVTFGSATPESSPPTYSQRRRRIQPAPVDVASPRPPRTVRHGSQQSNSTQMTFILESFGNHNNSSGSSNSSTSSSPKSRRTSLDSFESSNSSSSSTDEGYPDLPSKYCEEAAPWTSEGSRYIPGFAVILECDERSPRSEQQVKFFQ
ncbi:mucin-17-like [Macrobrachium nipponense]|uniref:mucin-17-like n=1 Tax=Macrobrachium nipponense TaxID=159736 RepID=UPI0030C7C0F5